MTCKNCIYEPNCYSRIANGMGDEWNGTPTTDIDKRCKSFKNKADFVPAVRCSQCKHYVANYCTRDIKGRTNMFYMNENDYCSYGERK